MHKIMNIHTLYGARYAVTTFKEEPTFLERMETSFSSCAVWPYIWGLESPLKQR